MHDANGRITLPGFYDRVRPLETEEREELARLPMDEAFYLEQTGAPALWGETGYTPAERVGARPTLEVNGLLSGFTGAGLRPCCPPKRWPSSPCGWCLTRIRRGLPTVDQYLQANAPPIRWELDKMAGGPPSITNRDLPGVQSLSQAMQRWGSARYSSGRAAASGSRPKCRSCWGQTVIAGFGSDDNLHAPNEASYPDLVPGIDTIIISFAT
jgi:hypothetical protein